jgi:hypothetical protein
MVSKIKFSVNNYWGAERQGGETKGTYTKESRESVNTDTKEVLIGYRKWRMLYYPLWTFDTQSLRFI